MNAIETEKPADNRIVLPETFDRAWIEGSDFFKKRSREMVLDFSQTKTIDSTGLCLVNVLHKMYKKNNGRLVLQNIGSDHLAALKQVPDSDIIAVDSTEKGRGFAALGGWVLDFHRSVVSAFSVLTEMLYWGTIGAITRRDFRKGTLGEQMFHLGYKALGIVGLLSFLIGVVLALQAAMQLKNFGAGVFLGPLIGITMVREMGPLLTAIILAGRTGSATTAEIGTMVVGEEIDALKTMGINTIQFIVVPKFWAITITMPLLSVLATGAGILGGYCIGILYLDLSSSIYFGQLAANLYFADFMAGFIKSVVFSWLIIWIGAYYGFRVHGGAESVGRETTASVVASIFIIIIADAVFSFLL